MTRDYAASSKQARNRNSAGKGVQRKKRKTAPTTVLAGFHAPSFSGGVLLGAALVLLPTYQPTLTALAALRPSTPVQAAKPAQPDAEPALRFEYEEILRNAEVTSGSYEPTQQPDAVEETMELYLQAASFRTQEEADKLRAELLLLNLPTSTSPVELASGRWIRVTVGPFASTVQARRAIAELRTRSIAPLWIKRKIAG